MEFRFRGIPADVASEVRATMRAPDYGHPAYKALAQGYGPCRLCLRTFRIGEEERILFTYNPFPADELPAPGPVFIHAQACERYDAPDFPPDLRALPMVLEAYGRAIARAMSMCATARPAASWHVSICRELERQWCMEPIHARRSLRLDRLPAW